jgi:hypothetical protein
MQSSTGTGNPTGLSGLRWQTEKWGRLRQLQFQAEYRGSRKLSAERGNGWWWAAKHFKLRILLMSLTEY